MPTSLVTVPEALAFLEEPDDAGGELQRAILRVSAVLIELTGDRFTKTTRVEYLDGDGQELVLGFAPVDTVASFVLTDRVGAEVIAATDYEVDAMAGLVRSASDGVPDGADWEEGTRRFKAEYTGGFDGVPEDLKEAALRLLARNWVSKVAGQTNESRGGVSRTISTDALPDDIRALLEPFIQEDGETG